MSPGVWIIRTATIIPDHEAWLHDKKTKTSLKKAMAWAAKNPATASDPEQLSSAKKNMPPSVKYVQLDLNNPEF